MTNPYLLLILGILMIFLEFFLPGIVMGTVGAVFVLLSVFVFANQTSSPLYLLFYAIVVIALLVGLVQFALWRIRRSRVDDTFFLSTDQEGFRADNFDTSLIGSSGVALTDLRPSGRISVGGSSLQAMSQGGFIAKGSPIIIIGGEGAALIVKPVKPPIEQPSC